MTVGVTPIEYKWKGGFTSRGVAPDVAGRELERLAKRDQEVVPITLVEESRAPEAPLHSYFEWDDSTAAEQYRENQARELIRAIEVVYVRNDTEEPLPPVRAYVSVIDEQDLDMYAPTKPKVGAATPRHYRPMVKVMSDADLRDQYRRQAFNTLCSWRDRYADIEDFSRIFEEIDTLKAEYEAGGAR